MTILESIDDALNGLLRAPSKAVGPAATPRSTERQSAGARQPAPEKAKLPPGRQRVRLPSRREIRDAGNLPNPYSGK